MRQGHFLFCFLLVFIVLGFSVPALAQDSPAYTMEGNVLPPMKKAEPEAALGIIEPKEPLPPVPDEYLEEAESFYGECKAQPIMNKYYDCLCLAAEYLDVRIKSGPKLDGGAIKLSIQNKCPDATMAAGQLYEQCLNDPITMSHEIPTEQFCECYASQYGKMYESSGLGPSSSTFITLKTQALLACNDPAQRHILYENAPPVRPVTPVAPVGPIP